MTPLLQPKLGVLTLASNLMRHGDRYGYWALCHCAAERVAECKRGGFVFVPKGLWLEGPRPEQCRPCSAPKRARPFYVSRRAPITPYFKERGR